ncbi:hypothetical protein B0H14DRAFT_3535535 [Mycena olivaceomarginata]|nr:hypothetical protein B0H14DRAFT_3535535 [Mycena olivaceomarginata]
MSQPSGSAAPTNLPPASNGGHALLALTLPPSNPPTSNNGGQALFAPKSPPTPRESPPPEPTTPTRPHSGSPDSWMNPFATPGIEGDFLELSPSILDSFVELGNPLDPYDTVVHGPHASAPASTSADVSALTSASRRDTPERNADGFAEVPAHSEDSEEELDQLESSVPATPARPPPPDYVADPPSPPPLYNADPFNLAAVTTPPDSPQSSPHSSSLPQPRPRSLSPPHTRYLARSNLKLAMAFYSPFGSDCDGAIFKGYLGTWDEEEEEEFRMQQEEEARVLDAQTQQWKLRRMWAHQERLDAIEQSLLEAEGLEELEREELEREELEWQELENQVGGGARRPATPPITTPTYLRPVIRRTPNAGPEVEQLMKRRERSMLPPPPPPPPPPSHGSLPPSGITLAIPLAACAPRFPPPQASHRLRHPARHPLCCPPHIPSDSARPEAQEVKLVLRADASAKSKGGRPSKEQMNAVTACHLAMDALVEQCAADSGLATQTILRSYHNAPSASRSGNPWNIYEKPFTLDADGNIPPLEGVDLSNAWIEFQAAYPNEAGPELLRDWHDLDRLSSKITVGARRRHFARSYINEDEQLAIFQATGGLEQIFKDIRPGLPELDQHEILGIAKSIATREEIRVALLGGVENADEADASAASRAQTAAASATPRPEQPSKARQEAAEREATHNIMSRLSAAAITDTKSDLFEVKKGRSTNFAWRTILQIMGSNGLVIMNWPEGVRVPVLFRPGKSVSSLTSIERSLLLLALDARNEVGQGLYFKPREYREGSGAMVLLGHDYDLQPPPGSADSPAVQKFWRSSTVPVHCADGNGRVWKTQYDFDAKEGNEQDEQEEGEDVPKGKGKEKANPVKEIEEVDVESEYQDELESEEEAPTARGKAAQKRKADDAKSAPTKRRRLSPTPSVMSATRPPTLARPKPKPIPKSKAVGVATVEPVQEGGGPAQPVEGLRWDRPSNTWVNISHGRPAAMTSERAVHFEGVPDIDSDSSLSSVPDVVVQPPPKRRQGVDKSTVVQHPPKRRRGAEGLKPPPSCLHSSYDTLDHRRLVRWSGGRATTFQRGGTIYSVANPQPIGEWYTADDDGVIGKFNEKLDPAPRQKKVVKRGTQAPTPKECSSNAGPTASPVRGVQQPNKYARSPCCCSPHRARRRLLRSARPTTLRGVHVTPVLPPVAPVVPVVAPVAAPVVAPPIDNEALSGVLSQFLQLLAGRDPNELFAALQGAPPT